MRELFGRISALDPEAGAAVKVIAYFDSLMATRTGLEPIVRGAAMLTGVPAGLLDTGRRVALRVLPDGNVERAAGDPDPAWCSAPIRPEGRSLLWVERASPPGPVEAMVLERASAAALSCLERTAPPSGDRRALAEVLVDPAVEESVRLDAARRFGLVFREPARAVAVRGTPARVEAASRPLPSRQGAERTGVGPDVAVADLPASWREAVRALRFTAEGTDADPGPRVVLAVELGGLALLAETVSPGDEPVPDVLALERAWAHSSPLLATLEAVAATTSLRAAAARLVVHHSTLQARMEHAEHLLGWSVRDAQGRLRLQTALALRRLYRNA